MKNSLSICTLLLLTFLYSKLYSQDSLFKEQRQVSSFQSIDASGIKGDQEKVMVEVNNKKLTEYLKVVVVKNELKIRFDNHQPKNLFNHAKVNVYVTYTGLKSIKGSGATSYKSDDPIETHNLRVELSGANLTNLNLDVNELDLNVSGASNLILKGHVDKFTVDASGASHINAFSLNAEDVKVETSGVASTQITALKTIDINASGVSHLTYKGEAKVVAREVSKMANAHKD
jgi:hypothetical protein